MVDLKTAPYAFSVIRAVLAVAAAALGTGGVQQPLFTLHGTQSCLFGLPHATAGLPPASPPAPPVLFVAALPQARLGAWTGAGHYEGIILRFFATEAAARAASNGGIRIRNVLASSDRQAKPPHDRLRALVLGCLRASGGRRAAPPPAASLRTFAGAWGGHTRGLTIGSNGAAVESVNDGCCVRVYDMTYRIVAVRGTLTHATATYRITSFRRHTKEVPLLRVGEVGTLVLRNGILTNRLTTVYFCSDPAWGATGACGA